MNTKMLCSAIAGITFITALAMVAALMPANAETILLLPTILPIG